MQMMKEGLITRRGILKACFYAIIFASLLLGADSIQWDWRRAEALTSKQSLRHAKLAAPERDAIAKTIAEELQPEMPEIDLPQLEDIALDAPVKLVDLNGDGAPEVIAQGTPGDGGCSQAGNCRFWVLQKSGREYKLLFYQADVQSFTLQSGRSNGFMDIVVKTNGSATESTVRLLQYREGTYREAACSVANWTVREGNAVHELSEPRLTPCTEK
jgi:hypothetical protein